MPASLKLRFPPADAVVIGYSGGKDSLALLDLCVRAGKKVSAFFMYFLPGMDYTAYWCDYAARRWGVNVRQYQHWGISYYFRRGVFRAAPDPTFPKITILDVERSIRQDTGLEWIGYGYKSIDSLQRRGMMNQWPDGVNEQRRIFAPLKAWNNTEVKAYLGRRGIPIPGIDGKRSTGISLTPECLEWLRGEWPHDYQIVLKYFPYAEAQADRAAEIRERESRERAERRNQRREVPVPGDSTLADQSGAIQPA